MSQTGVVDLCSARRSPGVFEGAPSPAGAIHDIAVQVEAELREVAEGWDRMPAGERGELARSLAQVAPGVLHLLCPAYGRFGAV